MIIVAFILSALRDAECQFSFSTEVQDAMASVLHRKRKQIVKYFKQSRFFRIAVNYSTDHHSYIRELKGARVERLYADQHNMIRPNDAAVQCSDLLLPSCDSLDRSFAERPTVLRTIDCLWQYSGDVVRVLLPVDWYRQYGQSFRDACTRLHGDQWKFVNCVKWSLEHTLHSDPSYQECLELAAQRKTAPWKKQPDNPLSNEEWAKLAQVRWIECWDDPLLYLSRVQRRLYYPLVSQSKLLRQRHLQFKFNGIVEPMAEVDMSATFWVLLATRLHDTRCKAELICDLRNGRFYQRLNEAIGNRYEDSGELKVAVQRDCLFGRNHFGKTELFRAMSELYPDLARFILDRRNRHNVTWMSNLLTNAEGSFFIDCLLPYVVQAGIPALPIHDCLCVPVSVANQVSEWCCRMAEERFGFEPHFKVKSYAAAV